MRKLSTSATISLIIVLLSTVCAAFCYLIVPDGSANANLQIPQLALLKPGSTHKLYAQKILEADNPSLFKQIIQGKEESNKYFPIDSTLTDSKSTILFYGKAQRAVKSDNESKVVIRKFWLGTDKYGRDMLSRLIVGLRVSLFVGLFAVVLSVAIGTFFGLTSGYFMGWIDKVIMTIINVNWSIPTLLLAFAILLVMDRGLTAIYLAIGLTLWVDLARILRGQVIELRSKEFVLAAQTMGLSSFRILWKHILPNLYGTILVMASINFATAILVEAGLSYLGLGVQPPVPSLGNMLKENYGYATSGYIVLSVAPALFILMLVLSFNLLGNGLRDYYDIRRSDK